MIASTLKHVIFRNIAFFSMWKLFQQIKLCIAGMSSVIINADPFSKVNITNVLHWFVQSLGHLLLTTELYP